MEGIDSNFPGEVYRTVCDIVEAFEESNPEAANTILHIFQNYYNRGDSTPPHLN